MIGHITQNNLVREIIFSAIPISEHIPSELMNLETVHTRRPVFM